MKYKKEILFICLLICMFSIASVVAGDVNETIASNGDQDNNLMKIDKFNNTEIESSDDVENEEMVEENQIMSEFDDIGTFYELSNLVRNTAEGTTLSLDKDYKNSDGLNQIRINKLMTIDGQGHTIDANHVSRIFYISANNVTLKNINFINGKYDGNGGAIYFVPDSNSIITNSNFINCSSQFGGAVYFGSDSNSVITNSNFINCSGEFGGAVYLGTGVNSIITYSNFKYNVAEVLGGCILGSNGNISLSHSTFIENMAKYESGAAITFLNENFNADYIDVIDCVSEFGAAITLLSSDSRISHSNFKRNRATYDGGAIFAMYNSIDLEDNNFSDNSAKRGGGLYTSLTTISISNNYFFHNSAINGGAIYAISTNDKLIEANIYENNIGLPQADLYQCLNDNLTIYGSNYYQFKYQDVNITSLPSYYNMVDDDLLTPVKDQGVDGNCWAFSAIAALESCILKASDLVFDLSEANLKNIMAHFSDYGYRVAVNDGGHSEMAYGYLASWLGPIFDVNDTYYTNDFLSPLLESIMHIQNILFLKRDDFTDNDDIKNAILRYGAVSTSMYYNEFYLNSGAYYFNGLHSSTHAVCIVGWDDNYSKYNFKSTPLGDGAWIVRNSWGPYWENAGYFYVSYYDTQFAKVNTTDSYTFILNDTIKLDRIYQLEIQPTGYYNILRDDVCYKNIFTVDGEEYLAAVSTYFVDECDYKVKIYVNNVLKEVKAGKTTAGYYTINLDNSIYLNKDDEVTVEFNCTYLSQGAGRIPVSVKTDNNNLFIKMGVSYYWSNNRWYDFYSKGYVACIKIFTKTSKDNKFDPYFEILSEGDGKDNSFIVSVILPNDASGMVLINNANGQYCINLSTTRSIKLYDLSENNALLTVKYSGDDKYLEKSISHIVNTTIVSNGTFEELHNKINAIRPENVLYLTKDYYFGFDDFGEIDGINILKSITIDGQDHIISGSGISIIFNIHAKNVILKNIKFSDAGQGAVQCFGLNCTIINCSFVNNFASGNGGAIYLSGDNSLIENCLFINNFASGNGGAIYLAADNVKLIDCVYIDNSVSTSQNQGGAIYWAGKTGSLLNCSFINNSAYVGSAILVYSGNIDLIDCSFVDNFASNAGTIYCGGFKCTFINSSFINNLATKLAGAIFLANDNNVIENCIFEHNSANNGGSVIISGDANVLINCAFRENVAYSLGGAIIVLNNDALLKSCSFVDNFAKNGGAIFLQGNDSVLNYNSFMNNNASTYGGAIYVLGNNLFLNNSSFIDNSATHGSSVFWQGINGNLADSTFTSNIASSNNDVVYWYGENGNLVNSTFNNNINSIQIIWNGQFGTIQGCKFLNVTKGNVINAGADFIKRNISMGYNASSFVYKNPKTTSVYLTNVLTDLPIKSQIIFNLTNGNENKILILNLTDNIVSICDELANYNVGIWNVTVLFEGDDNYYSNNVTFNIKIDSEYSSLKIETNNATVGHETKILVNIFDSNNMAVDEGVVTFFDGETKIGEVNVHKGIASLIYAPATDGKHIIRAIFNSNNYLSSNDSVNLFVDSAKVEILVDEGTVGFNSTFVANVKGLYSTVNEGIISFYVDDILLKSVHVVNGSASISYVPLNAKDYLVKVIFSDSVNFLDGVNTAVYNVNKANSNIFINQVNATVNHNLNLTTYITSSNNLTINEGNVTFMDGNKVIGVVDVKRGVASLVYTPITEGEHKITVVYDGNNYISSNFSTIIYVDSVSVQINAGTGVVGFNSTFEVNVNGLYSIINEGTVSFYINNNFIGKNDVVNGFVSLDYIPLSAGNNVLEVVYNSDKFTKQELSVVYIVNQADSQLTFNNIGGTVGYETTLSASIISSNNLIINEGSVTFMEEGNLIGVANVVNGVANLSYTPTKSGIHVISASFIGNNYIASDNDLTIFIDKAATQIIFDDVSDVALNNPSTFSIDVLSNNKAISEGIVKFFINDNEFKSFTVDNAQITFDYISGNAGTFTISAVFDETTNYLSSNATTTFTVNKLSTTITSNDVSTVYNGGKYLIVTLKDSNGKALNGEDISINIKGVKHLKTDSNGQVKLSLNGLIPKKSYSVTISFAEKTNYAKSTKLVKVTVKKATPKLTAKKKTFKKSVKTKKYTVTLKTNLNKPMKNTWVTLKVNKKTLKAKTNSKGKATFKITNLKKKGTFKVTVAFNGDKYYNKVTKKNVKIIVK